MKKPSKSKARLRDSGRIVQVQVDVVAAVLRGIEEKNAWDFVSVFRSRSAARLVKVLGRGSKDLDG